MVLTSHDQLGNTGLETDFWLEEGAVPYFVFRVTGVQLTLASPKGGQPPIDPKTDRPENQTPAQPRFKEVGEGAREAFANTVRLADVKAEDGFLSGRPRPNVGSRGGPGVHCSTRIVLQTPTSQLHWSATHPVCFAMLSTRASRW
jgi:putative intracellular protease/amidase